jgi:hypothetical protein
MGYLKNKGPITWKDIITTTPEIIDDLRKRLPGQEIVIPDASIMVSHRLTRINLRVNRRLRELKRNGKIEKKSMKFSRGCFNLLKDGKWKPLTNLRALGAFFPSEDGSDEQDRMEHEPSGHNAQPV